MGSAKASRLGVEPLTAADWPDVRRIQERAIEGPGAFGRQAAADRTGQSEHAGVGYELPRVVTIVGGAGLAGLGVWGMVSRSPCFALTITP